MEPHLLTPIIHLKYVTVGFIIKICRVSQLKRPAFEKILIPQYQSNDVENCRVLSSICQIRFSNLPGFNQSFVPSKTCKNERKQQAKFHFVLLPSNNDSWICSCILSSWENGIPLNKLFTLGEDFSTRQNESTC